MEKHTALRTAYPTLGILFALGAIILGLGGCPGLMEESETPAEDQPIIAQGGTERGADGRLYFSIALPTAESAAPRNVFKDDGSAASVDPVSGDGIAVKVLEGNMIRRVINYYELIIREEPLSGIPVYTKSSANLSNGETSVRVPVTQGKTYDVLLLGGTFYDGQKTLLASAYHADKLIAAGANFVSLTLDKMVTKIEFPSDAAALATALTAALTTVETRWNILNTDFQNSTNVQNGSLDTTIRNHLQDTITAHNDAIPLVKALFKAGNLQTSDATNLDTYFRSSKTNLESLKISIPGLIAIPAGAGRPTATITAIASTISAGNTAISNAKTAASALGSVTRFRVYQGETNKLTVGVGPQTSGRKVKMQVTFESGIAPLIASQSAFTTPYTNGGFSGFIKHTGHKGVLRDTSAHITGQLTSFGTINILEPPATSGITFASPGTFTYEADIPPGNFNALMYFTMQYYPFGNPFDTEPAITAAGFTPWYIRHGIRDQEAAYVPTSSPDEYSIGGGIRVLIGDGVPETPDQSYLVINLNP